MLLHFQYCMSNILINIIISIFFFKKRFQSMLMFNSLKWSGQMFIYEFVNAITFKHQHVSLFWYLDKFLEKDKTGLPLQINIA